VVDNKAYIDSCIDSLAVEEVLLRKNLLSLMAIETFSQYVTNLYSS